MKCPKCDRCMIFAEKDTSSGRDMRTYFCPPCEERVDVDNGTALWKVLSGGVGAAVGLKTDMN